MFKSTKIHFHGWYSHNHKRTICWAFTSQWILCEQEHDKITFASQEKYPFSIEIAGSPGSMGGFGNRILSSARSRSSRRFNETFALTTKKIMTKTHKIYMLYKNNENWKRKNRWPTSPPNQNLKRQLWQDLCNNVGKHEQWESEDGKQWKRCECPCRCQIASK